MFRFLFGAKKDKALSKADYSFGLQESISIKRYLDKRNYHKVEELLTKSDSDTISHVVDHLSLNTKESDLIKWHASNTESEAANLVLGVFYAHKGWTCRGNQYASEVSGKNFMSFHDFEEKAESYLKTISRNKLYTAEAYARLIRVYMSLGHMDKELESFNNCVSLDALKVGAYIHHLEAIEPKWGGSKEEVVELLEKLPDSELITDIITLKMLGDSLMSEEYLGKGEVVDITEELKLQMRSIDKKWAASDSNSILGLLVYNYMVGLSQETGDHDLLNKYHAKMNGRYTLYPFGITA
jgi:tetratricopeptide (TPR) repeat protein